MSTNAQPITCDCPCHDGFEPMCNCCGRMGEVRLTVAEAAQTVGTSAEVDRMPDPPAARSGAVPAGYALVPIKPTETQIRAGWNVDTSDRQLNVGAIYGAMIGTAPEPPQGASGLEKDIEILCAQRDQARAQADHASNLLLRILHFFDLSGPIEHNGVRVEFRDPNAAETLARLSRAVRELMRDTKPHTPRSGDAPALLLSRDELIRHDDYGVYGSDFFTCRLCDKSSGAGLLNKGIDHEGLCPLHPNNVSRYTAPPADARDAEIAAAHALLSSRGVQTDNHDTEADLTLPERIECLFAAHDEAMHDLTGDYNDAAATAHRLQDLLNTPELHDFAKAVALEAAHQRERWGSDHDAGKTPPDWFWLVGYLAGKALAAHASGNVEKALHHTISTAAALANWHASIDGSHTAMRPGIDPVAKGIESIDSAMGAGGVQHGVNCPKVIHAENTTGYLHAADDDTPYDVDGCTYCGRCHYALDIAPGATGGES
jgi:hypothetical protein